MISYTTGDLFQSSAYALVNTVNTVGVMGKGIALHCKELFPRNFQVYQQACKNGTVQVGQLLVVKDSNLTMGERLIINFPTKKHWRRPSEYQYIEKGLQSLRQVIKDEHIKDIAIPPLGCGNGGLDWSRVKIMIADVLGDLEEVSIQVYEPSQSYHIEQQNNPVECKLTDARAMLLYTLFYYEMFDEQTNLVVANKLCYFLQTCGAMEFNRMKFTPSHYGPYSPAVSYMLKATNGKYIYGLEQMDAKPFDLLKLNYEYRQEVRDYVHKMSEFQRQNILKVIKIIEGFESTFAIEVLATVAYLLQQNPQSQIEDVVKAVRDWSDRKAKLFSRQHIQLAFEHLRAIRFMG